MRSNPTNPAETPPVDTVSADAEAWRAAAASRKYRVQDGEVWSGVNGLLFPLPPLPGFASLPDTVRGIVFHAVAQFATYRVGQTVTGNVASAVANAITLGTIPAAKTNDAFESHYEGEIASRVNARHGALDKSATKEEIAARKAALAVTVEKYREQLFADTVQSGKDAALNKPSDGKKPRAVKATGPALDIGPIA